MSYSDTPVVFINGRQVFASRPVYLLAGQHSVGDWDIPDWARDAAVSLTIMPNAGHLMMLENPGDFGRIIATSNAALNTGVSRLVGGPNPENVYRT